MSLVLQLTPFVLNIVLPFVLSPNKMHFYTISESVVTDLMSFFKKK